jgi:hypothetical protein
MPQQFLHNFEFYSHAPLGCRIRMPAERVPSESLLNSDALRDGTNISWQDRLAPDRRPTTVPSAGKDPAAPFRLTHMSSQSSLVVLGLRHNFAT